MELMENITEYIDNRKHTVGIFIDLNKGFDTFNHKILLQKMERYKYHT